jgi:hypothetical protein
LIGLAAGRNDEMDAQLILGGDTLHVSLYLGVEFLNCNARITGFEDRLNRYAPALTRKIGIFELVGDKLVKFLVRQIYTSKKDQISVLISMSSDVEIQGHSLFWDVVLNGLLDQFDNGNFHICFGERSSIFGIKEVYHLVFRLLSSCLFFELFYEDVD